MVFFRLGFLRSLISHHSPTRIHPLTPTLYPTLNPSISTPSLLPFYPPPSTLMPSILLNLLQESLNMKITIETLDFEILKGKVKEIDDFMNIILEKEEGDCFVRGSKIRFIKLPDILKYSPLIKKD